MYIPNGAVIDKEAHGLDAWTPIGDGTTGFQFSPILKPLEPFRDRLVVVSGLGHPMADSQGDGAGDHPRSSTVWLSGVHPKKTEGADVQAATTIDQMIAREFSKHTQLASLELALDAPDFVGVCDGGYSCSYLNTISWRTPTAPLPMETNPRAVFERLFGAGDSEAERRAIAEDDCSILDGVTEKVRGLQKKLGARDRLRMTEYLESVRDIERRIQLAEKQNAVSVSLPEMPLGVPDTFEEHCTLMYELQALAYQADITRVTSFLISHETNDRTYPGIGVPDPHHSLSHHQGDQEKIAKLIKINTLHVQMFSHFLEKLRDTPDGDGSLLDHSLILYGGAMSNGQVHSHGPLPCILAGGGGGGLQGGRHLTYSLRTPMTKLLLSLVDKMSVGTEQLTAATGETERLSGI